MIHTGYALMHQVITEFYYIIKNRKYIFATHSFIRRVESMDDIVCVKITIFVWLGLTVDYIFYMTIFMTKLHK